MKALQVFTFFFSLFLSTYTVYSQGSSPQICADPLESYVYTGSTQKGGLYITSNGTIRVLVVFVQLKGDNVDSSNANWPLGQKPTFFNTFIDTTPTQLSTNGNISHYYRQMSFDRLKLYGDRYFVVSQHTESYYRDTLGQGDNAYQSINREVLQTLDSQIDYSRYDNWTFGIYSDTAAPDNKVDLIIMYYRLIRWPPSTNGIAVLGFGSNLVLDGKTIAFTFPGSGITNDGGTYGQSLASVKHEIGHYLFGAGHPVYSNTGSDYGYWGIMSASPHLSINAWERERLAWINFNDVTQNQSSSVADFVTTGTAYRILIPGTNEEFLVENHQKLSVFDNPNNTWPGKGLFILHVNGIDVNTLHPNYDIEVAEGKFNWSNPYWVDNPYGATPDSLPVFKEGIANVNGYDGRDGIPSTKPGLWQIYFLDNFGQPSEHVRWWGDEKDALNIGYNQVFSPWSNPNSNKNNGSNSGIAAEVTGKSIGQSGEDIFNMDFYLNNAQSGAPSKAINLVVTSVLSGSAALAWSANQEPDLAGYNVWRCLDTGSSEPAYEKINGSLLIGTTYTDNNYEPLTGLPLNVDLYHRYRITAVDNQGKESVKSEYVRAYFTRVASGTISANQNWQVDVQLVSDVVVNSGVNLTVLAGTRVRSIDGPGLTINGKLVANGSPTARITFTSGLTPPNPGDWIGIVCSGGGPDTLTYCDINYAETGLLLQNTAANSYMQNDTIRYSSYWGSGLTVSNTGTANRSLRMYKCGINSNDGIGLKVGNAKVSVSYSRIDNNGLQSISEGVLVYAAARVFFDSSRIQNNIGSGIKITGTGSRALLTPDSLKTGYNTVTQHGVSELWLTSSGSAFLGGGYAPGSYGGLNNVYNTYNYSCRLINNSTANQVSAKWTYWGAAGNRFCGPVDSSNPQGSPVNTPSLMRYHDPGNETMASAEPSTNLSDWLIQLKGDIAENNENAFDALHHLANFVGPGGAYQGYAGSSWEEFLKATINKSTSPSVKSLATALLVQSNLEEGRFTNTLSSVEELAEKKDDPDLSFFLQTRKLFAYVGIGDLSAAHEVLSQIEATASLTDSDAVKAMMEYVAIASKSAQQAGLPVRLVKNSSSNSNQIPGEYSLSQNFPNPFNPTTSFKYQLMSDGHVTLKIYDVLGREIATVVNELKEAGEHVATWDASGCSSGIYFYKLQAGTFTDVKKMLLVQ